MILAKIFSHMMEYRIEKKEMIDENKSRLDDQI